MLTGETWDARPSIATLTIVTLFDGLSTSVIVAVNESWNCEPTYSGNSSEKKFQSNEIVAALASRAAEALQALDYDRVHVRQGDGWAAWPEAAPFDAIIVTASSPELPGPLLEQLADGGRMLIPVERGWLGGEMLVVATKDGDDIRTRDVCAVRFVPLTGMARR